MDLRHLICCAAVFALLSGVDGGCSRNQWQCDDGVCVSRRWRCDGVSDCQDGSDEMDCVCQPGDVECADGSGCVIGSGVCDGRPQCPDASDEWDCSWRLGCLSGDWKCKNSICIPQELLCNDVNDCGDNSDEETCGSCGKMNIRCPDGACLTPRQRCDGVAQCSDKRDEPLTCGKSCHNGNGGCSHTCIDQLWGALCTCPTGMTLSANGLDCEDVNECAQSFGPCMHLCTNTPGSFRCLCQNGFKPLGNGSCEAQGAVTKLLTTRKGLIGLVNVKTRVYEPLFASESDPIAMTYNIQRSLIYWADKDGNIYQALNRKSTILYSGQSGLHSLAIDWLTGQLYWTSVTQKAIYTGAADGSDVGTVMSKEMDPRDMVLSPTESFIFWINKGTNDKLTIERVEMDGLNRTTLVFITAQLPRSLTMDVAARRLYWISAYKASIESIRTDGTGRHTFWDFFQGRPAQTLAVFNGWFYLADEKKLWQAPQNMSSDTPNGFILKASLPVLSIYHVLQQPQGFAPCKDSGCQLCLPSKKSAAGFTCLCPEGALPMSWGSCENFKVAYATTTAIYSLAFAGETPVKTELFTSDEDIQSFDMYWRRGSVVWSNGTGHVKTNIQSQDLSEYILTLKPACIVRVDQRTGNLYWLACDELSIGVSTIGTLDQSISRQLYQARTAILDLFVDWQRGKLYWLEGGQVMRMKLGLIGGNAEAIFSFEEDGVDRIVFDRKANGFLWNMESYLQVMSLLKMRRYSAGKDWVVPGSIMAAYEPYMVTLFNNILTVWNRKDGARVSGVAVENGVVSLSVALREVQQDTTAEDVRPTEVTCKSPLVICHGSTVCISRSQRCDGNRDCPDGSDEASCVHMCAKPGDFLCKDRKKCVERDLVCDGRSHCIDGSDEVGCPTTASETVSAPFRCRVGSKPCKDGRECVLYSHVCDGEMDCKDGSDEEDCEYQCKADQFQCAHGRMCIDRKQVCDGTPQCQDRSDELDCFSRSHECKHQCDNKARCIPESFLCDGEKDCVDATDEANCVVEPCSGDRFQCSNGQCVALALRCDGYADCRDHSDEKGCPQPPHCPVEQRCPHTHECLLKEWLCDGDQDCSDGSDEKNCKVTPLKCGEFQWSCVSKTQCIATTWRCDGVKDCKDESDESGCGQVKCPTHLFQCGSGECVDPDLVCNKASDCADGSDEGLGCLKNNCSSPSRPSCQHYCINTPHGARCGCKTGFRLQSDGLTCNDINECKEIQPAACSHKCLNTLGSYLCQCDPEFILEPDGHSCKTAEEPSLLISEQYELLNLGLRSSSIQALIAPGRKAIFSLDYDRREQKVYWVSLEEESIKYAFHGIKDNIGTIVKGVKSDSIAIDWMGRNLYWVDGVAGQILAVRLTSSVVEAQNYITVVDKDLHQPRSLVLLPQKGIMFWSEIGGQAQIERSGMDGSDRKVVVSRGLERPVSVTVDILTDRLYWTDEKLRCIGSATLDGENIRLLQLSEMPRLFSVAVFNDMVYWSDTHRRSVQGANKLIGKNRKVLLKRPGQPFDLKVVHPLLQPNVSGPCEKLRCSHVCLLAPGLKAVCRCPAGLLLAADGFACATPVDSSSSFLMLLSPNMITQIFTKSLQAGFGLKTWPEHRALPLPAVNEASDFDLLRKDSTISVADAGRGSVAQLKLSGSVFTPIGHVLQLKGDLVTALAVDWVTRNLYWSSVKSPQLYVTSPGGKYTSLVLPAELEGTISIALHPPTGRLCFTAMGWRAAQSLPQVDCAHMDGSNRTLLWSKAKMPASLAFSEKGTTLYWADIGNEMISSINMDGSNYKEYSTGSAFIVSFARVENIYFWITLDNGTAKVWYTDGFQPKLMWFEVKANVIELKAYSRSSQKGTNVCSENNGGCSHLCLPYPGGRSCRCAQDYLSVNKTKCVSNLKCPAGSKACRDGLTCISAAKFCDQIPDCQDGSDEECGSVKIKPGVKSKSGPGTAQSDRLPALASADGSESCEAERCSGHGTCVSVEGEPVCECEEGYSGDLCQNAASSSTALALTLTFLFGGALMAAVVLKRRRAQAAREEATEKETLVTDVEEHTTYSQNFANELYDPEEAPITPAITTPVVS
uniref:Low-density lipoprotein receptor-related protein 2-like n=1 Tax=Sinocyclocheilus rhinocerous TaxID=307959 RepID=A0A673M814_9TELE